MLEIERASARDFPAIDALARQLHDENIPALTTMRQDSRIFIARDGGRTIGFAICTLTDYGVSRTGQLEELSVDERERGSGAGRSLVATCEAWLAGEGIEVIFVSALVDAVGFYQTLGYQPCIGPWLYRLLPTATPATDG